MKKALVKTDFNFRDKERIPWESTRRVQHQ